MPGRGVPRLQGPGRHDITVTDPVGCPTSGSSGWNREAERIVFPDRDARLGASTDQPDRISDRSSQNRWRYRVDVDDVGTIGITVLDGNKRRLAGPQPV